MISMLYALAAIILSIVGYWIGLVIGVRVNLESLGVLFAVLIMGSFNICVTINSIKKLNNTEKK